MVTIDVFAIPQVLLLVHGALDDVASTEPSPALPLPSIGLVD